MLDLAELRYYMPAAAMSLLLLRCFPSRCLFTSGEGWFRHSINATLQFTETRARITCARIQPRSTDILRSHPAHAGIKDAVARDTKLWRPLYEAAAPHTVPLPGHYNALDTFQRLVITRCVRPDKITPAVQDYVRQHMDARYVEPPPFNLDSCYHDSNATSPLIFILSAGSDPTAALLQFASEKGMDGRMHAISLGQGQGPKAAAIIAQVRFHPRRRRWLAFLLVTVNGISVSDS